MKTIPHVGKLLFLLAFFLIAYSCSKNDDDNGNPPTDGGTDDSLPNIVALAESVNMLSSLVEALEVADAGLVEALSANGTLTVFAPTNDAFNALIADLEGFDSLTDFDETSEKELLAEILKYHVVSSEAVFSDNLSNGRVLETLQSEALTVNIDGSVFIKDKTNIDSEVVGADNEASNGVVHIVNKILLPDAVLEILFPKPSLLEVVAEDEDLSLLEEAITKADLVDTLDGAGPFTIFAPSNSAIEELFTALGDEFNSFDDFDNAIELQILKQILLYHVVVENISSGDLASGMLPTLLTGDSIEIIASGDTFVIGDASTENANILSADNEARNGIVHRIDKILIPTEIQEFLDDLNPAGKTIKELVEEEEELSFLEEALLKTGLLETLGGEGPFTVFAPSDEGLTHLLGFLGITFDSIEDFDTEFEINLLRDILLYHVAPREIRSTDLSSGNINTLLADNPIEIVATADGFALRDAINLNSSFLFTDIPAKNGIIHIIDRILLPRSAIEDLASEAEALILDFLESREDLDEVREAFIVVRDNIGPILNGRPFTFFFPNDQAFVDLFHSIPSFGSVSDFNTSEARIALARILAYHCIAGDRFTAAHLTNGRTLTTFQGEDLTVNVGTDIYILDATNIPAKVIAADNHILNGVIHIIDKVLIPQEVLDLL
ncbi:MAG: fasciclin domain-containing protein [Saonia sp.]